MFLSSITLLWYHQRFLKRKRTRRQSTVFLLGNLPGTLSREPCQRTLLPSGSLPPLAHALQSQPSDVSITHHCQFPRWLSGKESACQCRRSRFDPLVGKTPCSRKWQPTPVFLPERCHGQWNLVGYSPWGHRESDMTGSHAPCFPNFHSFLKTLPSANTLFLSSLKQLVIAFASQTIFDPWSI